MPRPIRMYSQGGVYFVTARTTQRRLLLRPSARLNEVVGGVLAKAVQKFGVELYAFAVASNHLHLLVRTVDCELSEFMQFLLSSLAVKVGLLHQWPGKFWGNRFAAEPVLDDDALIGRLGYILAHGVKEGLVGSVAEWPGLSCLPQLLGDPTRAFPWFSWQRRYQSGRLRKDVSGPFADAIREMVPLTLTTLPAWEALPLEERERRVRAMVGTIEAAGQRDHPHPLGVTRIVRQHPHARPRPEQPRRRPWCHTVSEALRRGYREAFFAFVAAYRDASLRFRAGDTACAFPAGSFKPPGFPRLRTTTRSGPIVSPLPTLVVQTN